MTVNRSFKEIFESQGRDSEKCEDRPIVCVQGLGFVGSAMAVATSISKTGSSKLNFNVIGIDLDTELGNERIDAINQGIFPFNTNDALLKKSIENAYEQQNLIATSDESAFSLADIIIIDIHLDINFFDDEPILDFSTLEIALGSIATHLKKGTLIIVETTVPPGTCEKVIIPKLKEILSERNLSLDDIFLAHSYERVMPGDDYLDSIINFWRVFSGMNNDSADLCEQFLSKIINIDQFPLTRLSSMTASETAKVLENTYRAVNIALIDEWTKYAELVGIDIYEVIDSIRKRPTHSNMMYPGLGVGGYCLTKDSSFAPAALEQVFGHQDKEFPFSNLSRKINNSMPMHAFNHTLRAFNGDIKNKRILIFGVSYRQNVGDTRFSPSEIYANECSNHGAQIEYFDPHVEFWPELDISSIRQPVNFKPYDLLLIAVPHSEFIEFDYNLLDINPSLIIIDAANLLGVIGSSVDKYGERLIILGNGQKKYE
jgi:nucleotide sugar dehydrogenase